MQTNWSLLAGLRIVLATIVAGAHLVWFRTDSLSRGLESFGGKAAVVGFLLVSGYSIAASLEREASGFYFRRFKRIYPMYFFAVIAGIALEAWLGNFHLPNYVLEARGPATAIGNLLMLQMFVVKSVAFNGVVWSLAIEAAFYIASPFLRRASFSVLLALVGISAAFYVMPLRFDGGSLYALALKANVIKYFWPFAMGFVVYYNRSGMLAGTCLVFGMALVWLSDVNYEQFAVVTFAVSFGAVLLARSGPIWSSRFLDYLGDVSYPLYLAQIPTFVICYQLFGITNPALLLAITFAVAIGAYELIDVRLKRLVFAKPAYQDQPMLVRVGPLECVIGRADQGTPRKEKSSL